MHNWTHTRSYARHERRVGVYGIIFALSLLLINLGGFVGNWHEGFLYVVAAGIMLFLLLVPMCVIEIFVVLVSLTKHRISVPRKTYG